MGHDASVALIQKSIAQKDPRAAVIGHCLVEEIFWRLHEDRLEEGPLRGRPSSCRALSAPTPMAMQPIVISVTVAHHAPAPVVSMTPTTTSSNVHADARSAITVTPAVAAPPLPDDNA